MDYFQLFLYHVSMYRILFICHGNICRSTMAQSYFNYIVQRAQRAGEFLIDSAAVSSEEEGNGIYPPAESKLKEKHIPIIAHTARRITEEDILFFDYIYVMDRSNMNYLIRYFGTSPKFRFLLDREVSDPWYTNDFEAAYQDIKQGCDRIFTEIDSQPFD